MYQRVVDEMLLCIDHVYTILDDILIAGHEVAHHDLVLETVFHCGKSHNLRLKFNMCVT